MSAADAYLVDPAQYRAVRPRIVWLLKEVNDPEGKESKLKKYLGDWIAEGRIPPAGRSTAGPVAKVSHALLNPDSPWTKWSGSSRNYVGTLGRIGWVNLKEIPGGSSSDHEQIRGAYLDSAQPLREAIRRLRPEVVIGGNTLQYCSEWLDGWIPQPPTLTRYDSAIVEGAIWVNAHHPANRGKGWSHRGYFDRIKDAIERHRGRLVWP